MLYLLQPHGPLQWKDMPVTRALLEAVRERDDVDRGLLDWKVAERPLTEDGLRITLRHGVACTIGSR
jgi:hypothetical protein